jgi:hypothetical protein
LICNIVEVLLIVYFLTSVMPFNRVSSLKESSFWYSFLLSIASNPENYDDEEALHESGRVTPQVYNQLFYNNDDLQNGSYDEFNNKTEKLYPASSDHHDEVTKEGGRYYQGGNPIEISSIAKTYPNTHFVLEPSSTPPYLDTTKRKTHSSSPDSSSSSFLLSHATCYFRYWVPGLLVIPIPSAGYLLGYIDYSFWACICYLLGSILYLIDAFLVWKWYNPSYSDDANNPALYLNTYAAGIFVLNAILCFIDWYIQLQYIREISGGNEEENEFYLSKKQLVGTGGGGGGGKGGDGGIGENNHLSPIPEIIEEEQRTDRISGSSHSALSYRSYFSSGKSKTNNKSSSNNYDEEHFGTVFSHLTIKIGYYYHLFNNFFFLIGALIFLYQGIIVQNKSYDWFNLTEST